MVQGVPDHVDGRMLAITEAAGGRLINRDRMWHYTEGIRNWNPIWPNHGIRILPGPSSLWLDALGKRLPPPLYPGFDNLGTLEFIAKSGHEHTWFVLNQAIIKREFALSGSEQNPDLTGKDWRQTLGRAFSKTATGPVEAFKKHGADFVIKDNLVDLVAGMNAITAVPLLDFATVEREVTSRDQQLTNRFGKDSQLAMIRQARGYIGDKLIRVAEPHALLDPKHGPLIAVKLNILTRKTLGGFETDLSARVFGTTGTVLPGLYAVGEAAGFGGGGVHGYPRSRGHSSGAASSPAAMRGERPRWPSELISAKAGRVPSFWPEGAGGCSENADRRVVTTLERSASTLGWVGSFSSLARLPPGRMNHHEASSTSGPMQSISPGQESFNDFACIPESRSTTNVLFRPSPDSFEIRRERCSFQGFACRCLALFDLIS